MADMKKSNRRKAEKKVSKKPKKIKKPSANFKKIKQHITQVFLISLIIFFIIFCIYQIISLIINPTESFIVEQGTISQEESLIGYVIRDEKIIQTENNENKIVQIKNEGERVAVGETVFRYEATNEQELNVQIAELNKQIQEAMEGQEGQNQILSSDIKALESQIEGKIDGIQNRNNIQEIKEYKKDINGYITKKAKISGELSPAGSYINNLINQRTNIENELKNTSKYKVAPISGIVSYRVDNLEEELTPQKFNELSITYLENLNLTTGQIVTTSDLQGKIINNFESYIAVKSSTNEAKNAKKGDKLTIRLATNQEIPVEIEEVKQEEKETLLILKMTQGVEYLSNYRKISLDIIWWKREGLRVPNTSIIYENGQSYVIRKKAGSFAKILVKIVRENNNNSIITNYKTEELQNMGYTVEDITKMRKISIYDEILTDPDIEKISKELD